VPRDTVLSIRRDGSSRRDLVRAVESIDKVASLGWEMGWERKLIRVRATDRYGDYRFFEAGQSVS